MSTTLFALAAVVRLWAVGLITFPMTEGSAYYVEVARNIATGRGFVIDALWSYATGPLTLPRPAFELWQPMASALAALPMTLLGPTFQSAQLASVLLGALLAPLAWLVASDAARRLGLPPMREAWIALGAGLLAAISGPFLLATAIPDSALPFTVFAVAACLVMPRALAGDRLALIGLGVLFGLAYLTRLEAVWLGVAFAILAVRLHRTWRGALGPVAAVAGIAALVATPWWLRNIVEFGTPFSGQLGETAFLTRNEQIFAWAERPTLDGFLAQGLPTIAGNIGQALWHNILNVLVVPAGPIAMVGAVTIGLVLWRRGSGRGWGRGWRRGVLHSPLGALLISGALTLAVTTVLFPVATLWGTFEHASGPLLVALAGAAVIGGDAFVAWLVRQRQWQRTNAWMAPLALVLLTLPVSAFQLSSASAHATEQARIVAGIAAAVPAYLDQAGVPQDAPVITDHPVWLLRALGRPAVTLPDEPVAAVLDLARHFGARAVIVAYTRGAYPGALEAGQPACFGPRTDVGGAALFLIDAGCLK
jgi:hypothetical protein